MHAASASAVLAVRCAHAIGTKVAVVGSRAVTELVGWIASRSTELLLHRMHGKRRGVVMDQNVPRSEHEVVRMAQIRCQQEERGIDFQRTQLFARRLVGDDQLDNERGTERTSILVAKTAHSRTAGMLHHDEPIPLAVLDARKAVEIGSLVGGGSRSKLVHGPTWCRSSSSRRHAAVGTLRVRWVIGPRCWGTIGALLVLARLHHFELVLGTASPAKSSEHFLLRIGIAPSRADMNRMNADCRDQGTR